MGNFHCQIVGLNHHMTVRTMEALSNLASDTPLDARLEREPENRHDPNAIKVIITDKRMEQKFFGSDEVFIGYVRRQLAVVLAKSMDKGSIPKVKIESVDVEHGQAKAHVRMSTVRKATPVRRTRKTAGKRRA